ncbi:MAG: family 10 glycosylhydrolase [Christensenellales bacterium]
MHYESYLYCDTLKWVNNEWINYILPQTYWAQNHSLAPYEKLINWWNQAVSKKNVNLYAGMGIYMWLNNANEAYEQLVINDALENVQGTSIYSYNRLLQHITIQMLLLKNK